MSLLGLRGITIGKKLKLGGRTSGLTDRSTMDHNRPPATNQGRRRLRDPLLIAIFVLLVVDIASRFSSWSGSSFYRFDTATAGTGVLPKQQQQQSRQQQQQSAAGPASFNNSRLVREDASCGAAWSLPGLLTGDRTSYAVHTTSATTTKTTAMTMMINTTIWSHRRSGAPSATGTVTAQISHCGSTGRRAADDDDHDNEKTTTPPDRTMKTTTVPLATTSSMIVRKESVLCRKAEIMDDPGPIHHQAPTVVLEFGGSWDDLLGDANLNLWHFHAALFRLWAGVQIGIHGSLPVIMTAAAAADGGGSSSGGSGDDSTNPWVVLSVPAHVFARFRHPHGNVLVASPARLLEHVVSLGNGGTHDTTTIFEGLQGVADAFHGRLLVSRSGATTVNELQATLREQGANPEVTLWIVPPDDGLFWDLAWDQRLRTTLSKHCRNSLLHQYRNDILAGLALSSTNNDNDNVAEPEQQSPQHIPRPPNQHVCFMSRQRRNKIGTPDRGNIRNLSPPFLLQLLGRLGSPILLTPSTALRQPTGTAATSFSSSSPRLIQVEQTSVAEQMQFVYDECAVLIGVHGAGMTNALGLRPGTSVIELMSRHKADYQYFANVARLLNDVDYVVVATLDGDGPDHEENLHAMDGDDELLDRLHDLVEQKLQVSFHRQQQQQQQQ
jgi:hypothetical protein